jgi:diguanylate cyclase (GGDEF)-like protein
MFWAGGANVGDGWKGVEHRLRFLFTRFLAAGILLPALLPVAGIGQAKLPDAVGAAVGAAEVIAHDATHDGQLLRVHGKVAAVRMQGSRRVWTLVEDGWGFEASSAAGEAGAGIGDEVTVTGVCRVQRDPDGRPTGFRILMRSPVDLVVLRRSSWWTARHLALVMAGLGLSVLSVGLWVATLRHRVGQQAWEIVESERRARFLATHDPLTHLPNRSAVLETLREAVASGRGRKLKYCVAIVDMDHFKSVNDTYGHPAGDLVLRAAADRLSMAVRETDVVGRYGGGEFLIVFREMTQMMAPSRCEQIRMAVCGWPVECDGVDLPVTCSIGVSSWPDDDATAEILIAEADSALYAAKENGRNRVEYYTPEQSLGQLERGA